jgi:hypothetical protein
MEDLDRRSAERWERLEKHFEDASAALQERDVAFESRLSSLELLTFAQYTTVVVADIWGAHYDSHVGELEHRMADLELIFLAEIRDECDDRVETLEEVVEDL